MAVTFLPGVRSVNKRNSTLLHLFSSVRGEREWKESEREREGGGGQSDRQTGRQTDRQTNRQIEEEQTEWICVE